MRGVLYRACDSAAARARLAARASPARSNVITISSSSSSPPGFSAVTIKKGRRAGFHDVTRVRDPLQKPRYYRGIAYRLAYVAGGEVPDYTTPEEQHRQRQVDAERA
jgi:fructose-1,6-bisphosphatase/inositol monophosphatase family enzyme